MKMRRVLRHAVVAIDRRLHRDVCISPLTSLTADDVSLIKTARDFCTVHVKPVCMKMDETGQMEPEVVSQAFASGLMAIETSEEYGGAGMTFPSTVLAIEEIARADAAVALLVDLQNLISGMFVHYANPDQQREYLPRLSRRSIACFCLTEPGSGSDAFALKTAAIDDGDAYVINGTKIFISSGSIAEIFLVMANVDFAKGYKGITCFIVDRTAIPGVKIGRIENKLGIRASSTTEVRFDEVRVPKRNVLGEVGGGYRLAIETLNDGRIGIGAQMVGIAQGALDAAMPYLFERKQFGRPIGDFQGMQFQYAQAAMELHTARLLVYNAARKKMLGEPAVEDAAMAKLFSSQVAERTASKCVEWMGGCGFMKEFSVERFYRDAKIGAIYEGTSNIQLHTLAKITKERYKR